ncbi:metal-sensitive transcriptional regulator [Hydrogenophaga sp.]|jgi:DNA-binding FrmR family transcriptional regulator|uniref:metal-sensitive transcriptional regulator n=1 Tax=Hydrogenophaga sp. TaxID=1904254 RepID=UPI003F6FC68A
MTATLVPSPLPTPSRHVGLLHANNGVRTEHQREVINRLKRIEGQVRGLIEMVDSARPCEDVAQQMSAARKAMDKAFYRMMACTVMEAVSESASEVETFREVERSTRILEKYA